MSELGQISTPHSAKLYWWKEAWAGARPRFVATGTEVIASVGLLLALGIIYLVLRLLIGVAGVPADDVAFIERADVWAVKGVSLAFSVTFFLQSVIGSYGSLKGKS